jgi:transposase InsO family protein
LRDRDLTSPNRCETWASSKCFALRAAPWQKAYGERLIGTIRRECLDHVIILSETALYRQVKSFVAYYHESRTHLSLDKNSPESREV